MLNSCNNILEQCLDKGFSFISCKTVFISQFPNELANVSGLKIFENKKNIKKIHNLGGNWPESPPSTLNCSGPGKKLNFLTLFQYFATVCRKNVFAYDLITCHSLLETSILWHF